MTEKLFVNKYQPLLFDDFVPNNPVIEVLKTLVYIDELTILLIGDMATGKTSLLNALIREYYAGYTPKEYEENILYINNLKEQGINYYRVDVKTFCQTCSNIKGKKKFVVLDDIDLINEQSQQVFRNCIDKFSHNVNFVSSCTNNQKVIESLQSRFTIIKIKPLMRSDLFAILQHIKQAEGLDIDPDAEEFTVNVSNYTVKVLINYMEKFKLLNQRITLPIAIHMCSNVSFLTFEEYTNHVLNQELVPAIHVIYNLFEKGYSVMDILDNYFVFVKTTTLLNEQQKHLIIPYICKYITIFHNIHEDQIELSLFTNNLIKALT